MDQTLPNTEGLPSRLPGLEREREDGEAKKMTVEGPSTDRVRSLRTLVSALNLISRSLPLPSDLLDAVFSIYYSVDSGPSQEVGGGDPIQGDLLEDFQNALLKQRLNYATSASLKKLEGYHLQINKHHRLNELEDLPISRGEDMQMNCLLELYGLRLLDLQRKVRADVSSEYWLQEKCSFADKHLFDWGMMRLRRSLPLFGNGDASYVEVDDHQRKRRDEERLSRLEQEEKNRTETRKRKFFNELLNASREFQNQAQAALKRRKQRNDGIQAWHARQRQRATRAERLRFQALKADDQEAYLRMVEESKNERLTTLLGKTNELLFRLGAAVQRQKDAEHADGSESVRGSDTDDAAQISLSNADVALDDELDMIDMDSGHSVKTNDLLEGQRTYNSVIHSIQEKVTEQPAMLQGGELRSYQLEGLQWMLSLFNNNLNGILADEMGLGKTIQTIALLAYLMENKGVSGPHLIVAPKAVLSNWVNEFATWAPSILAVLYDGRAVERKVLREEYSGEGKFNVMITHYDLIMRDKSFLKKIHWYYMIVDEGHRLKNHDCALSRTLVTGYHIKRRLLLTGTPIQNSLQELWSLLNFLLPSIFNCVKNFEEWFNAPFADRSDISLTDEEQLLIIRRLHQVIRPFLLRRKKDEVEKFLPGKIQVILKCDLSGWQKVYYQQITDIGRVGLDSSTGKSKSLLNLSMQLRKCCNHPYLFVGDYNMHQKEEIVRASGKFELLDRLLPKLQKSGHRVLLFSQMTRLMDILEIYLSLHGFTYMRLDGATKTEERGALLKKFNAPDSPYFMFLLSTRAGGLGLNLQTADTVILFDSDWNPQMDQQAEDRAHRIGQKKEVRVFVLVSVGSIEEEILERAKQKMGIDAKDRREMLQEIMRRGTNSLGTDVPSEREINRLAARSDEEFWLFEKMDEERRHRENYRSRLMEEHEVPEWAFAAPNRKEEKAVGDVDKNLEGSQSTGKRRRKEVIYTDLLSDVQWMKAVESGEDLAQAVMRSKRKEQLVSTTESTSEMMQMERQESENGEEEDEGTSGDLFSSVPRKLKSTKPNSFFPTKDETLPLNKDEVEYHGGSGWPGDIITWKAHKRRTSHLDSRAQQCSNRGNGWM
ncbi:putative ATP-dependent DNA helicase [Nymphaea thermarum]|nr:putative ATP-dependent DNA helicase [Nymphaea thermarum]